MTIVLLMTFAKNKVEKWLVLGEMPVIS